MNDGKGADQAADAPTEDNEPKQPAENSEAPEDEEKPDPFDTATESLVRGDAATRKAYRQGQLNYQIKGSGPVVTHSQSRDIIGGDVINVYATSTTRMNPGPVRAEELERIRASYVKVAEYDIIYRMLEGRRLILLRGPAGTGRTTTTLHLLDRITNENGQILRWDPEDEIHSLKAENLEDGHGYLVELPTSRATALTQVRLDGLGASLEEKECWCVLIVGRDFSPTPAVAGYVADYRPPDCGQLLRRHLTYTIPEADADVREKLRGLADSAKIRAALGSAPSPAEMVGLGDLLVDHSRQNLSIDDVVTRCATFVHNCVADWFHGVRYPPQGEVDEHALRFIGYRIALAVLNRTSQHLVAEAGEKLGHRLILTSDPLREPGRPVFASEHRWWLEASRGKIVPGNVDFGDATVSVQLAAFDNDRMPLAVLAHVWAHHHNARTPLLHWLDELARSLQPEVWVRAAQAVGLLCSLDFTDVFYDLINGWAEASDNNQRRRIAAAYALDQAARFPEASGAVREVIARWKRSDDEARRWTAAAAFGLSLGLTSVEDTLEDLLELGVGLEDETSPIAAVASESIAQLLAQGEVDLVTQRLRSWWRDKPRRGVRDVVLLATIKAANIKVGDLDDIGFFTSRTGRSRWRSLTSRGKWPLLLALQNEDPQLTEPFAELIGNVLDTARSRDPALKVLTEWIRCAESDPDCLYPLAEFLALLAGTPEGVQRLQHLVAGLRAQWQKPLAGHVADYLQQWLTTSRNGTRSP